MDLFKLIFEHDLRLDELKERQLDRSVQDVTQSIEDFLKPDPTYSKFYLSGTRMGAGDTGHRFGIDRLEKFPQVIQSLEKALGDYAVYYENRLTDLKGFADHAEIGNPAILTLQNGGDRDMEPLKIGPDSNVGHRKSELAEVLEQDDLVVYKEPALQGFDVHLFSKKNIYPMLFYPIQELLSDDFRFFSINGKRIQSERKFYFETWTLENPPHGVEEVIFYSP